MALHSLSIFGRWTIAGLVTAVAVVPALMLPKLAPLTRERKSAELKTIGLLDGYVQTRFEEDNNRFGMERLPPPVSGHGTIRYQLVATNAAEALSLKEIHDLGFEYIVEFVHCAHPPGRMAAPPVPFDSTPKVLGMTLVALQTTETTAAPYGFGKDREPFRNSTEEPIQKRASDEIRKLMKGTTVDATIGTWRVAYRPVRASGASCLRCHTGAAGGDVLGIMAYAVRPAAKPK